MAFTYNGIVPDQTWEKRRQPGLKEASTSTGKRLASVVAAAAVAYLGIRRKRLRPLLLPIAGSLFSRAITGPSARRSASPVASVRRGEGRKIERSILVNRPVAEVYQFWRNFENLPRFMDHLESVTVLDETRSRWTAKAPAGARVEWEAVIHNEIENELIAWRSLPGADINHAGSVHFTEAGPGRTDVRVVLSYEPPAGELGVTIAKLLGEEPSQQVADDLRRFKQVMEAGEVSGAARHHPAGRM